MPDVKWPENDVLTDIREDEQVDLLKPKRYAVVFHNDDFTTQDFVIHVLVTFFYLDVENAERVMWQVHQEGKAKLGQYTKDIAQSKVTLVTAYSRESGMPLLLTIEPVS